MVNRICKIFHRSEPPKPAQPIPFPESAVAHRFLDGLNGIEIGGNAQNPFGLWRTGGGYANVDFDTAQSAKWQMSGFPILPVNIVANGDDLPFRDDSLDYVVTSHVLEHFFDTVGTLREWLRVVRPGGYVFCIVPHCHRTYDCNRPITDVDEMFARHRGDIRPCDYIIRTVQENTETPLPADYMRLWHGDNIPDGYVRLSSDSHRHQAVFDFHNLMELCRRCDFNVVYSSDVDDKVGTGFTIVIRK